MLDIKELKGALSRLSPLADEELSSPDFNNNEDLHQLVEFVALECFLFEIAECSDTTILREALFVLSQEAFESLPDNDEPVKKVIN